MPVHYFTLEEANNSLSEIEPLMAELLERRAKVIECRHLVDRIVKEGLSEAGGPAASRLVQDFIVIERLLRKIRSNGCIIKDLNTGLVDFLSELNGRSVYLCWRYGEPRIEFYHELHTGFAGRVRL